MIWYGSIRQAGRRVVGIPQAIIPVLREHLSIFVKAEPGALAFPGLMGGPLRRGNFNKMSAWPHAVKSIGTEGLHFHDLRHTGNQFAAASGAGLRDLMARMGHDSERAAMIYQHEARGADRAHHGRHRHARPGRAGQRRSTVLRRLGPATLLRRRGQGRCSGRSWVFLLFRRRPGSMAAGSGAGGFRWRRTVR